MLEPQRCGGPGCRKMVLPNSFGRKFCSTACRQAAYVSELEKKGKWLEDELPLAVVQREPDHQGLKPEEWDAVRTRLTILRSLAPGTAGYRLGCSSPSSKTGLLRWFPTYSQTLKGFWTVDPYEEPHVPYAGQYVIAYFDDSGQFLSTPKKIYIHDPQRLIPWRDGDQVMEIRSDKWIKRR